MDQSTQFYDRKLIALTQTRAKIAFWDKNLKRKLWDLADICNSLRPFLEPPSQGETVWPEVRILYDQVVEKYRGFGGDPEVLKNPGWDKCVGFEKDERYHTNRLFGSDNGSFFFVKA